MMNQTNVYNAQTLSQTHRLATPNDTTDIVYGCNENGYTVPYVAMTEDEIAAADSNKKFAKRISISLRTVTAVATVGLIVGTALAINFAADFMIATFLPIAVATIIALALIYAILSLGKKTTDTAIKIGSGVSA